LAAPCRRSRSRGPRTGRCRGCAARRPGPRAAPRPRRAGARAARRPGPAALRAAADLRPSRSSLGAAEIRDHLDGSHDVAVELPELLRRELDGVCSTSPAVGTGGLYHRAADLASEAAARPCLRLGRRLRWYILVYIIGGVMATAKLFWNGRSQAVRLPAEY